MSWNLAKLCSFLSLFLFALSSSWLWPRLSSTHMSLSLFLSLSVSSYGYKSGSLDASGACLAALTGLWVAASGPELMLGLLAFFLSSSRLTKWRQHRKKIIEGKNFKSGGQRDYVQVFCNGFVVNLLSFFIVLQKYDKNDKKDEEMIKMMVRSGLAALACCNGDTWASEIGSVVSNSPRLVTSWKSVPAGTNGGISLVGTAASFFGGLMVGLASVFGLMIGDKFELELAVEFTVMSGMSGLMGSLIDSLLGATLQYSGRDATTGAIVEWPGNNVQHISGYPLLNNHAVNWISCALTALAVPCLSYFCGL